MQNYDDTMDRSEQQLIVTSERYQTISSLIHLWLASKEGKSGSQRTKETYEGYITAFRDSLTSQGYDLDGLPIDWDGKNAPDVLLVLSLAARAWGSKHSRREQISASTYNQRLAVLSSFYQFARKQRLILIDNPIDLIDRRDVQEYAHALPLEKSEIMQALKKIDRSALAGKRDYALILVFLSTGRRAKEVLNLCWSDVQIIGRSVTLHFRCKGGTQMHDKLEDRVSAALLDYLYTIFRDPIAEQDGEHPLWLAFSRNNMKDQLSMRGLSLIIEKHLGTGKVHTTRHTFAHGMEKQGATVTEIQRKLGHSNPAITGRYLQQLSSAENERAGKLLDYFGVENYV